MLKLRSFTFKGHSVVWLAGSIQQIVELAQAIARADAHMDCVALQDLVPVENPDNVRLFAVSHAPREIPAGDLHWPCFRPSGINAVVTKIRRIVQGRSLDESFDLWPAPAELLLECARAEEG